jgi:Outer membrane protein beta-barrel domain
MKNSMIRIIAICLVSTSLFAQNSGTDMRDKLTLGFKVGGNFSNIYDTEGEEFSADGKFGSAVGVFIGIPLGSLIGLQPEIMYSQKGFKGSGQALGTSYAFERTSQFVDVPLLLTIKPSQFFTILAGPQFSFLTKTTDKFTASNNSVLQEESFDNDNLRKNTLGFNGGFDFNFNHVVLGTRAGFDFQNNNGDGTSSKPRYKNSFVQATVGFRF